VTVPVRYPETQAPEMAPSTWAARGRRFLYLTASLYVFVFALLLMRAGAGGLEPLIKNHLAVSGIRNAIGFGWLFAYAVMSGSPAAAASLTLLDRAILSPLEAFGMITGSRLGASFVVLFLGFVYSMRGHERRTSLSAGILAFTVTGTTQVTALALGSFVIGRGMVPYIPIRGGAAIGSITDRLVGGLTTPVAAAAGDLGGPALVFVTGLGAILASFGLFDRGLPPLRIGGTALGGMNRLLYRPIVMFCLGMLVTAVSMSVSLSLSLLVPLSARGYVRRENLIPYIMGANMTTFIDTMLASLLLINPMGFTIVLVQMASVGLVSLVVLAAFFHPYEHAMLGLTTWITASDRHLATFLLGLFAVPLILLLI